MLVKDIIRRVRDIAGDTDVFQFTDSTLLDWINDGIRECAVENALLQKRASTVTAVNVDEYELPTDIFKFYSILVGGRKIDIVTLQEWEAVSAGDTATGSPLKAYVWAGKLTLWPKPNVVEPLQINYIKDPGDITFGNAGDLNTLTPDTPALPSSYHLRLVTYCLAQVAMQDDDINQHMSLMADFREGVLKLKSQHDTEEDLYPFINVSARDAGGYGEAFSW